MVKSPKCVGDELLAQIMANSSKSGRIGEVQATRRKETRRKRHFSHLPTFQSHSHQLSDTPPFSLVLSRRRLLLEPFECVSNHGKHSWPGFLPDSCVLIGPNSRALAGEGCRAVAPRVVQTAQPSICLS